VNSSLVYIKSKVEDDEDEDEDGGLVFVILEGVVELLLLLFEKWFLFAVSIFDVSEIVVILDEFEFTMKEELFDIIVRLDTLEVVELLDILL